MRTHAAKTAIALLAAATIAGCGGDEGISDQEHKDYVKGCTDSGQSKAACECIYTELTEKQGIDTMDKFEDLSKEVEKAGEAPDPAAALPPEFKKAAEACRSQLTR